MSLRVHDFIRRSEIGLYPVVMIAAADLYVRLNIINAVQVPSVTHVWPSMATNAALDATLGGVWITWGVLRWRFRLPPETGTGLLLSAYALAGRALGDILVALAAWPATEVYAGDPVPPALEWCRTFTFVGFWFGVAMVAAACTSDLVWWRRIPPAMRLALGFVPGARRAP